MICVFSYFYIYMICANFLICVISNLDFKVFVCFTCFPHDVLAEMLSYLIYFGIFVHERFPPNDHLSASFDIPSLLWMMWCETL